MSFWNVNRVLLAGGAFCVLIAHVVFNGLDPAKFFDPGSIPPILLAAVGLGLALWGGRPWAYLVGGVLMAVFPLMILFLFGAIDAFTVPGVGSDVAGLAFVLLAAVLGLAGGIGGFVQGRKDAQPAGVSLFRTHHGLVAAMIVALVLGGVVTSGFASAQVRDLAERPASLIEGATTLPVVLTGYAFAPREMKIPVGEVVVLKLENGDSSSHSFTYRHGDALRESIVPAESTVLVPLRFTTAQTIHVWCVPHTNGPEDRSEDSMWGTMVVS